MADSTDLDPYEATVADLLRRDMCPPPLTVTEDEPLLQMAQEMLAQPAVGIIVSRTLAEHFFVEEFPEVVFGEVADLRSSLDAVRVGQRYHSASEMMSDPVAVRPDDSLHDAFVLIHATRATGLPVVDESGRPVAYLDLMTVALLHGEDARTD
jgi:hypothetical protein